MPFCRIPGALGGFLLLLWANGAYGWFRLPCTHPLVEDRIDPIGFPGQVPSQHLHTVHGGYNFNSTSTYDGLRASRCTSCQVAQDLSNYWFPTLYFRDPRTHQYEVVPNGGLLVYYQNRGKGDVANGGSGLKAFPPGFKMISGDPTRRAKKYTEGLGTQEELAERAISYTCLRYTTTNEDVYSYGFPSTDCEAGFQGRIHMPSCWDGQNLDSPDHRSHVAFLSDLDNGECPESHSVYLMKLFYEVTWDVHHFSTRWTESDGWPFVYSTGDPTGYSWHGDFQNGWNVSILQGAIDHCNNPNDDTANGVVSACPLFTIIDAATADQCDLTSSVRASVVSNSTKLPGCNPLQAGPMDATAYTDDDCPNGAGDSDAEPVARGHGGKCRLTKQRFQW